ncbi:JAB domain-containing protein [Caldicellulosiruptoraceae bacterium PP1]
MYEQLSFMPALNIDEKVNFKYVCKKYRLTLVQEKTFTYNQKLQDVYSVVRFLKENIELQNEPEEVIVVLAVKTQLNVIGVFEVARGVINSCATSMREIFKRLIIANATSFIFAHNHPSGLSTPSAEDIEFTRKLKEAGNLLGIRLLDSVIISESSYYSFVEEQIL